jgi:hypothetical protein
LSASEAPDPGRHHVGTPGDIISECPGDFVGIRSQLRRTTELHTTGHRTGAAVTCPGEDQLALELGKSAQDRQHQPAMRGGGVRPCTVQRLEAGAGTSDRE